MSIHNLSLLQNIAGFLFFALCICLPRGYSIGALMTVSVAILSAPIWLKKKIDFETKIFVIFFLLLGVLWSHSFDAWWGWVSNNDVALRYGLGALCLLAGSTIFLKFRSLFLGLVFGALGASILAIFQYQATGRAAGFTNAIRFGDIAISIAFACACFATLKNQPFWMRLLLAFSTVAAVFASLLSMSRGGWLALAILPMLCILFVEKIQTRMKLGLCVTLGLSMMCWAALQVPSIEKRVQIAVEETQRYLLYGGQHAQTSVGARLEHWQLSWHLGMDKPLVGWGDKGVKDGKRDYVARGDAHPYMLEIAHSHNEFLEMWSRRGALGVIMLFGIYGVPAFIFYPTRKRLKRVVEENRQLYLTVRIVGLSVPLSYMVYGLTETFFDLSIGHMFYIFSMVFFFSAMKSIEIRSNNE